MPILQNKIIEMLIIENIITGHGKISEYQKSIFFSPIAGYPDKPGIFPWKKKKYIGKQIIKIIYYQII